MPATRENLEQHHQIGRSDLYTQTQKRPVFPPDVPKIIIELKTNPQCMRGDLLS